MNTDLLKRIEKLEKMIQDLSSSNTIPLSFDQALKGRGFLVSIGNTGTAPTQVINTSGATATVPAQPSGTIAIMVKGTTYNLLYK